MRPFCFYNLQANLCFTQPPLSLQGSRAGHGVWEAADAQLTSVTQVLHQTLPHGTVTIFLVTNHSAEGAQVEKSNRSCQRAAKEKKRARLHADAPHTTVKGETKSQIKEAK